MPPKDAEKSMLFFSTNDGVTYEPIGRIVEAPEIVVPEAESVEIPLITGGEMTFTAEAKFNLNMLLVLIGRARDVPNNWLRMHGFPMHKRLKRRKKTK